jgi:hypothetical protein
LLNHIEMPNRVAAAYYADRFFTADERAAFVDPNLPVAAVYDRRNDCRAGASPAGKWQPVRLLYKSAVPAGLPGKQPTSNSARQHASHFFPQLRCDVVFRGDRNDVIIGRAAES